MSTNYEKRKLIYEIRISRLLTLALIFCFCPPLFSSAQLINTKVTEPSTTEIKFNPTLVKTSKIKKITLLISNKPDLQMIEEKSLTECYEFDSIGMVKRSYTTKMAHQEKVEREVKAVYRKGRRISPAYTDVTWIYVYDTAFTWYFYDAEGRLNMKRANYGDFFTTWYYTYNGDGQIIKEVYCKENNLNMNVHDFKLGVQTVLSSESFQYVTQSPTQVKKLCYNDEGKVYKQGIINRDSNVVEENYSFVVGYVHYINTYKYDNNGRLLTKTNISNSNGDQKVTQTYEYDADNNLSAQKLYKNELNTDSCTFIYDESKRLVKARLDRDIVNSSIVITKFTYEFFP